MNLLERRAVKHFTAVKVSELITVFKTFYDCEAKQIYCPPQKKHSIKCTDYTSKNCLLAMEGAGGPFNSGRLWLYRPKQKAAVFMLNPKKLSNTCMAKFDSCLTFRPIQLFISFYERAPWVASIERS